MKTNHRERKIQNQPQFSEPGAGSGVFPTAGRAPTLSAELIKNSTLAKNSFCMDHKLDVRPICAQLAFNHSIVALLNCLLVFPSFCLTQSDTKQVKTIIVAINAQFLRRTVIWRMEIPVSKLREL